MVNRPPLESGDYELAGFVGDHSGSKASLMFHRPVVKKDNIVYVAMTDDWSGHDDLMELASESPYVAIQQGRSEDAPARSIAPGQGVWVAGFVFANRCGAIDAYGNQVRQWSRLDNEFLYHVGNRAEFREFSTALFHDAARSMAAALSDPRDITNGRATSVFEVLNHLHEVDRYEQAIERGIYYFETSDAQKLEYVTSDAVRDGLVEDEEDFSRRVHQRRAIIKAEKLRDLAPAPATPPMLSVDPSATWSRLYRALESVGIDYEAAMLEMRSSVSQSEL